MSDPSETIYFIEDDLEGRFATQLLLELSGWQVLPYGSAEEFLDDIGRVTTGCILADYRMPGMSGLQLFHALREAGNELPVILISGHAEPPMIDAALSAGVAEFLLKPIAASDLKGAIHRQLAQVKS